MDANHNPILYKLHYISLYTHTITLWNVGIRTRRIHVN